MKTHRLTKRTVRHNKHLESRQTWWQMVSESLKSSNEQPDNLLPVNMREKLYPFGRTRTTQTQNNI